MAAKQGARVRQRVAVRGGFVARGWLGSCVRSPRVRVRQEPSRKLSRRSRKEETSRRVVVHGLSSDEIDDLLVFQEPEEEEAKGECYGCGAHLQTRSEKAAGYVKRETYEAKKKHRQLNQILCSRCHLLCNGKMVPGIEDWGTRLIRGGQEEAGPSGSGGDFERESLLTPDELRRQLLGLKSKRSLVLHLVDLTDIQGTFLRNIRDLVSKNPVMIIGTKMDLLPKGSNVKDVADWLHQYIEDKGLNPISVVLCSSKSRFGIRQTASLMKKNRKGRDVMVIGAANVGKSAFIRSLLNEMSSMKSANYDVGAAQIRHKPVESDMPGTTLGIIPLRAFERGGVLFDTPGLHLEHRLIHMMLPSEVKSVLPRRPLSPYIAKTPASILFESKLVEQQERGERMSGVGDAEEDGGATPTGYEEDLLDDLLENPGAVEGASATYLWGDVARLDVLSCPMSTHLVFCGSKAMRITAQPLVKDAEEEEKEEETVNLWGDAATTDDSAEADVGEDLGGLTVPLLKERLRDAGLKVGGRKDELIERLLQHEASVSPSRTTDGKEDASLSSDGESSEHGLVSVRARGGLTMTKELVIQTPGYSGNAIQPIVDICISGVPGWITVYAKSSDEPIRCRVYTPRGIQTFLREPFPIDVIEY
ncbi:nitric-oxide synthase [Chloropicon primus]|uniref:Nitric-oxide synthase n=2 Tax=Chloropicon primus TaxID=1764295 RepID=A0A5B8MQW7_9CHLO|nr:nitric-oxide synthase [Chloropicon primus]UPR02027.1 nitric-oxide synthase [Chloropicon primus]|eukprot:QDZ22803.1 nitric-oxide synthase [Chloropicon primus]